MGDADGAVASFERVGDTIDDRTTTREASEALVIRIAVALEAFLSEWMVRSLAQDPEVFRRSREQAARTEFSRRYRRWLTEQFGPLADGEFEIELSIDEAVLPRQPTLSQSRAILRAEDEHLRFGNAERLRPAGS